MYFSLRAATFFIYIFIMRLRAISHFMSFVESSVRESQVCLRLKLELHFMAFCYGKAKPVVQKEKKKFKL